MKIGGVSIILLLGMLNMVLILFQMSTGLRWIRVPIGVHGAPRAKPVVFCVGG